jgi:hypothetical protein
LDAQIAQTILTASILVLGLVSIILNWRKNNLFFPANPNETINNLRADNERLRTDNERLRVDLLITREEREKTKDEIEDVNYRLRDTTRQIDDANRIVSFQRDVIDRLNNTVNELIKIAQSRGITITNVAQGDARTGGIDVNGGEVKTGGDMVANDKAVGGNTIQAQTDTPQK